MDRSLIKTYPVTGMSCASCALNVERMLKRQPGVSNASVNYANGSATVELKTPDVQPGELQSAIRSIGYDLVIEDSENSKDESDRLHHYRRLKFNMIGALLLSMPVMIISMFFMDTTGHHGFQPVNIVLLILTFPVLAVFGRDFFINAFRLAKHGQANMDTLVALSTGIAFLFSLFNSVLPDFWLSRDLEAHVYYEASSVIIAFILVGKVLEERAKSRTSASIKKLMGLQPETASLIQGDDNIIEVPVARVNVNDVLLVRPGDKIPVDGVILTGESALDEGSITGESMPVDKSEGDKVYAGTLNIDGSFRLKALQVGSATILSRIIHMVQQAQGSKAPVQKKVDKIAGVFVPVVMVIALLTFTVWLIAGGSNATAHALMAMVTVLVIACPCALGLATPTAIMVGMGKGARNGILIKDAESLERIHKVNAIIFDKTGTLTEGKPQVVDKVWLVNGPVQHEYEKVLLAMEKQSGHPLANAIVESIPIPINGHITLNSFENISGKGLKATFGGSTYFTGSVKMIRDEGIAVTAREMEIIDKAREKAHTVVLFADTNAVIAIISLADTLKPTSVEAVKKLSNKGIKVYMLTGDDGQTAASIARQAGITEYKAGMLPADKAEFIKDLQRNGQLVAMAGDGINDSQALAQADVSIAMGKGSDIAMDVAGMTIIKSDLGKIAQAITLSGQTVKTINQNLFWAFIYNLLGIPIAAGILYPVWGFMLNPMIAAAAMALSSVSVVTNSLRLKGKKL